MEGKIFWKLVHWLRPWCSNLGVACHLPGWRALEQLRPRHCPSALHLGLQMSGLPPLFHLFQPPLPQRQCRVLELGQGSLGWLGDRALGSRGPGLRRCRFDATNLHISAVSEEVERTLGAKGWVQGRLYHGAGALRARMRQLAGFMMQTVGKSAACVRSPGLSLGPCLAGRIPPLVGPLSLHVENGALTKPWSKLP